MDTITTIKKINKDAFHTLLKLIEKVDSSRVALKGAVGFHVLQDKQLISSFNVLDDIK